MRKLATLALLLTIPAMAQAKTLEDLLVEKGVITAREASTTVASTPAKVYWNNGTRLEFPDNGFTLKINTQLQASYAYTDTDDDLKDAGIIRGDKSSFGIDRARLILSGTALHKEFSYKVQGEFTTKHDNSSESTADIKDAYIQWEPCEKMGYRLGQFKTGISRQYNTSSWALQIPKRSVISDTFDMERQAGLRAFYSTLDESFSVYGSIYNGESDNEGAFNGEDHFGADTRHAFDAGIRANILGHMNPFIEGDIDMTEDLALNVGAVYSYSSTRNGASMGFDALRSGQIHRVSTDVNLKYNGFSANGEFFWAEADYDMGKVDQPIGFYVQTGYFFTPNFEIAARYGFEDCDDIYGEVCSHKTINNTYLGVSDINEAAISLNYYFWKHNLKAQLAYIFLNKGISSATRAAANNHTEDNTNVWMFQISAYL